MSLTRLVSSKRIFSPYQNFYVAVSMEYRLRGIVPEHFYIDQLMNFIGRHYYVSLLSATALHGASHQQSMTYFVTADGGPLRNVRKKQSHSYGNFHKKLWVTSHSNIFSEILDKDTTILRYRYKSILYTVVLNLFPSQPDHIIRHSTSVGWRFL